MASEHNSARGVEVDEENRTVTFRVPDFEGDGQDDGPNIEPAQPGETGTVTVSTSDSGRRTSATAEQTDYSPTDRKHGSRSAGEDNWIDSGNKTAKHATKPSVASGTVPSIELARTRSVQEGEVQNISKKRTYLHRANQKYGVRLQRHTHLTKFLAVLQNVWTMCSTFPYWDMAFWSGFLYAVGSAMFIIDGAFAFGPLASPNGDWPEFEEKYFGPLLFFFGAVVCYQSGAVMAYLEAINDGCFAGVAMKRYWVQGSDQDKKKFLDAKLHLFFGHIIPHHHSKDSDVEDALDAIGAKTREDIDPEALWKAVTENGTGVAPDPLQPTPSRRAAVDHGAGDEDGFHEYMSWRWWPTYKALKTYHSREIGYVACSIQLLGATLYTVTGVVVLPGILSSLAWWQELASFWIPQVVASCCFLIAAIMFTIESQDVWYKPLPLTVRWWIGGWAAIGSVGFLLCACFGIGAHWYGWCEYQSDLSSMWGSAAYLFSSLLQWYEAVSAGPVLAFPNNRTPVLMRKSK